MSAKRGSGRAKKPAAKAAAAPAPKPVAPAPVPAPEEEGPAAPPALDDVEGRTPVDIRKWLPIIGLFVGIWAFLPAYSGPELNTKDAVEFADHVIPGIVILGASGALLLLRNRPGGAGLLPLICGMAVLLSGFWMVATHVSLVGQAFRDEAPWDGTMYHTASAVAVFGLGLLWVASHWSDLDAAEAAKAGTDAGSS